MDEELNIDLVISYAPGRGSIKRVNTRSLQVSAEGDKDEAEANIGDGAGANREREPEPATIWSWLRSQRSDLTYHQIMAMKVIPYRSLLTNERMTNSIIRPGPRETAKQI